MKDKIIINRRMLGFLSPQECLESIKKLDVNNRDVVYPLKINNNKFVGLLKNNSFPGKKIIIKNFYLKGLKRIVYSKYAIAEYNNLLTAQNLGINTPSPIMCYSSSKFLPKQVAVLMEYIDDSTLLDTLIKQNNSNIDDKTIELIAEMLVLLYSTGANHIDLSPDNIFFQKDTGKITIIDWQYANFVRPYSINQIIMQTAQLIQYFERFYATDVRLFVLKLVENFPKNKKFENIASAILSLKSKHLSKKEKFNV